MNARVTSFDCYGALLTRLLPTLRYAVIADADAATLWSSDVGAEAALKPALAALSRTPAEWLSDSDGLTGPLAAAARCAFRVRSALAEPLALVAIELHDDPQHPADPATLHARIKPALDCLQSELSARAAVDALEADLLEGTDALAQIPGRALDFVGGVIAALFLPDRNLSICRSPSGEPCMPESDLLAQLHSHLLTRAQVHRRTLVATHVAAAVGNAAGPSCKVLSTPVCDEQSRVVGVLAVVRAAGAADFRAEDSDTLELLARKAGGIVAASFDHATGLLTRAAFIGQAQARLATLPARAGSSGLLYIDIDQLHVVNENHGMPVGDEIIEAVAVLLRNRARSGALAARLGGDRFAMFVPGCSIEPVARIAEEVRAAAVRLSGPRTDKPLLVSISVGVARIAETDRCVRQALAAAELACHSAKDRGRNRVEVFYGSQSPGQGAKRPRVAAPAGIAAVNRDSLELLAQPVLPLGNNLCTPRFEILMRMRAPDGARLNFEKLTALDPSASLARSIDTWVIDQTITRLTAQRALLRRCPAQFSINLSAESLGDTRFWVYLERLLHGSGLDAGTLAFEFAEDAALSQVGTLPGHLRRLCDQGVLFALDNFGRGLGSLSNLSALPVAAIKLDGALSRDLDCNPHSRSMVTAIARLAESLGLETVATQVETDAIRAQAASLGVDFGQGFFIGRLLDFDDAVRALPLYSCFEPPLAQSA